MTNNNNNINELVIEEFIASLGIVKEDDRKGSKTKMKNKKQKVHKMKYNSINKSNAVNDEFLLSL